MRLGIERAEKSRSISQLIDRWEKSKRVGRQVKESKGKMHSKKWWLWAHRCERSFREKCTSFFWAFLVFSTSKWIWIIIFSSPFRSHFSSTVSRLDPSSTDRGLYFFCSLLFNFSISPPFLALPQSFLRVVHVQLWRVTQVDRCHRFHASMCSLSARRVSVNAISVTFNLASFCASGVAVSHYFFSTLTAINSLCLR